VVAVALYIVVHKLKRRLKDSQNISWNLFLPQGRKQNLKGNVWCAQNREKGGDLFTDVTNVKQGVFRCSKASHRKLKF
jgi:hypothetical protein